LKTKILIALLTALVTISTASAGILYAIDDASNTLLRIDPNTAAVTTVGSTGVAAGDFGDLTYNPIDGLLYWIPGRSNNNLYTIDPNTGLATLVGWHGIDDLFSLAFDTLNNVLYGDSTDGNLYTLSPGSGAATLVGTNGVYPGGLVYNSISDVLYLLQAGADELYMIDRLTGGATLVAGGSQSVYDNGIAYDSENDNYWAVSWAGELYQYNPTFSVRTTYAYGNALDGVAFVPDANAPAAPSVPEPGSFFLLGGGLIAAALFKRRRG
jgi:PEP-CTERM motif